MGGSAKKGVAGYFYYLGMHLIACHGPADFVSHILADDKIAWSGYSTGGPLVFFNTNLFGGPDKEGGLAGRWDIEMGKPDQGQNPYLALKLAGNLVPAFRGVVGFVAWQNYVGTTTYLKKLAFRISRIHVRTSQGIAQWYDAKAQIGAIWSRPQSFLFALDCSASMDEITSNGETRLTNAKNALASILDYLIAQKTTAGDLVKIDIDVSGWGTVLDNVRYYNASLIQLAVAKTHVLNLNSSSQLGTDFRVAANGAQSFFTSSSISPDSDKSFFFMTDGEPNVSGGDPTPIEIAQQAATTIANTIFLTGGRLKSFCFNIDLDNTDYTAMLDTTPGDAVPVISGNNPIPLFDAIVGNLQGQLDMNPAHIIRECLTDPDWGMGYPESDIDDASFIAAADKLYSEAMGMSLLWTKQITIEDFIKQVMKHIDATLYVDMNSGKFVLKLIRDDYDIGTLLLLDENNIDHIADVKTPTFGELTNSVTVQFWDSEKYRDSSLTVQDSALADMQQAVINTTVDYSGFTNATIASRAGQRDLKTLSTPLLSCTIYANRDASQLNIGHVFKLSWADYAIVQLPMRVVGIAYGDGKRNQVRITATQDVFSLPDVPVIAPEPPYVPPSIDPIPVVYRLPYEVPYLEAVQQQGQAAVDAILAGDDGASFVGIAGERPNSSAISADMQVDSGSGYAHGADINFCPTAVLDEDIDQMATSFAIRDIVELDNGQGGNNIPDGTWFQMGTELMVKVSLVGTTLTVKRGVLDTVPVAHTTDEKLFFWDTLASNSPVQYTEGNTVNVKMLPRTFNGVLDINVAPSDALTFVGRLFRPYPPGNFKVNGSYFPTAPINSDLNLTWSSRNRRQQTGAEIVAFPDANVTPEPGTTYRVTIENVGGIEVFSQDTPDLFMAIPLEDFSSSGTPLLLKLFSLRDGVASFQSQMWTFEQGEVIIVVFTNFSEYPVGTTLPAGWSLPWVGVSGQSPYISLISGDVPADRHYLRIDDAGTGTSSGRRAVIWDGIWASNDFDITVCFRSNAATATLNLDMAGIVARAAGTLGNESGLKAVISTSTYASIQSLRIGEWLNGASTGYRLVTSSLAVGAANTFVLRLRVKGNQAFAKAWTTPDPDAPNTNEPLFWQGCYKASTLSGSAFGPINLSNAQETYVKSVRCATPANLSNIEHVGSYWPEQPAPTNTNSVTLLIPTNVEIGDLMIATIMRRAAMSVVPTGWTLVNEIAVTNSGVTQTTSVYKKVADASDLTGTNTAPKQAVFTIVTNSNNRAYGTLSLFRSPIGTVSVESSVTASPSQIGNTNVPLPSLAALENNSIGYVGCSWVAATAVEGNFGKLTGAGWMQLGVSVSSNTVAQVRLLAGIKRLTAGQNLNDSGVINTDEASTVQPFGQVALILKITPFADVDFVFPATTYTPPSSTAVDFVFPA